MNVKWSKQKFTDLDLDPSEPTAAFKALVFSLTAVEPERQKIMVKGGIVKDEENWSKYKLKAGMTIMMMGTPSGKEVQAPSKLTEFLEDQESAGADEYMPPGLTNISNTCYMNSTIQFLGASKEMRAALQKYAAPGGVGDVAVGLGKLYAECEQVGTTQTPMELWGALRQNYPQFDEQNPGGRGYAQQDADECWGSMLNSIAQSVRSGENGGRGGAVVDNLFYGSKEVTMQCEEDADEPPTTSSEKFSKLQVNLNPQTTHVSIGLKNGIDASVEKNSAKLGRDALYKKSSKLSSLPYYLTVQFVRFEFVVHSQKKTKIIRACNFDMNLDVYELCSDSLKEKLKVVRTALKNEEDKRMGLGKAVFDKVEVKETAAARAAKEAAALKALDGGNMLSPGGTTTDTTGTTDMELVPEGDEASTAAKRPRADEEGGGAAAAGADGEGGAVAMEPEQEEESPVIKPPADAELPENVTGCYELCAILTHKGPGADGGHYVAFVRHSEDVWCCFDDDTVTECRGSELPRKVDGGTAHNHMAYMLLYRTKDKLV